MQDFFFAHTPVAQEERTHRDLVQPEKFRENVVKNPRLLET